MPTLQEEHDTTYADRRKRFNAVLDSYELGLGDWREGTALPGCTTDNGARLDPSGPAKPGRYVVICESNRGFGYFAESAENMDSARQVAGDNLHENWWPVCLYDLDTLTGDEPILMEGDRVRYNGAERVVSHHDYESAEGEPYPVVYLDTDEDCEGPLDPDNDGIELIERAEPDKRMPVRYKLARVEVVVAFNSTPED